LVYLFFAFVVITKQPPHLFTSVSFKPDRSVVLAKVKCALAENYQFTHHITESCDFSV